MLDQQRDSRSVMRRSTASRLIATVRSQAQLAVEARRKGDHELVERLMAEIASNRKQAE